MVHELEPIIDLLEREPVGDERIHVEPTSCGTTAYQIWPRIQEPSTTATKLMAKIRVVYRMAAWGS